MLNLRALIRPQEEDMVHPVQGPEPDKAKPRTYKTLEPVGEIAVVQRPEGAVKILFYTCSGADSTCHTPARVLVLSLAEGGGRHVPLVALVHFVRLAMAPARVSPCQPAGALRQ